MLLLNVRRNFSSDQKVFERLVLLVGDNWRFRIYLAESDALSLFFFVWSGHRVLIRTVQLVLHDRFRKLRWLPSSVAFQVVSRVVALLIGLPVGWVTKVVWSSEDVLFPELYNWKR